MLHYQGAGDVTACWGLVMGGGACGVGSVGDLVLGLTTQDKCVLIGGMGTLICSLNDGRAVCLRLERVSERVEKGGNGKTDLMWREM